MALIDDLREQVRETYRSRWETEQGQVVPATADLKLSNHAKELDEAVVLYADLDGSTAMVDTYGWQVCAEVYKSYLRCAARIINNQGGTITAYDGDRVMAVFIGDSKNTMATRAALMINYVVREVINPELKAIYTTTDLVVKHTVGIDMSPLRVARIGVRGDNDLVWIGRAANHAAKLTSLDGFTTWISGDVYGQLNDSVKLDQNNQDIWSLRLWPTMNNKVIYGTDGWYRF